MFKNLAICNSIDNALSRIDPNDSRQLARLTLTYIAFITVFWAVMAMLSFNAPHKDSVEELFWMQSPAWGYPKFGAGVAAFG
jgi:hypothetical protein